MYKRQKEMGIGVSVHNSHVQEEKKERNWRTHAGRQSYLKALRRARGLTLEGLSELTGISPSYLSRLEGGARRLNTDLLEKLSSVLECQPADLLNGIQQKRLGDEVEVGETSLPFMESQDVAFSSLRRELKELPVYGEKRVPGNLRYGSGSIDFSAPADWTPRPPQLAGVHGAFALYMQSDENAPRYFQGDVLYVHPTCPLLPYCSVVAVGKEDRVLVRQFRGWGVDSLQLAKFGHVPEEDICAIPCEHFKAVYKVFGTLER